MTRARLTGTPSGWPTLPRDSFAAAGAGGYHVWCSPRLRPVAAECPGLYGRQAGQDAAFLAAVVAACRDAG